MVVAYSTDNIINVARTWLGTPYKHQHSCKHVGCDCLGFIRGVYTECVGEENFEIPPYTPSWGELGKQEILLQSASKYLIKEKDLLTSHVIVFRMMQNAIAKHCGILTSEKTFIHSYYGKGVVESSLNDYWRLKIVGVFSFPKKGSTWGK